MMIFTFYLHGQKKTNFISGRKFKTVMTDRYFDGKDPNGYWLCQEDTCMKYCKRNHFQV